MSRLSTIARRARYRKPPPQEQQPPPMHAYRDRPDHLADAGGAYLVLPYGLLDQLSAEQQQQIVHPSAPAPASSSRLTLVLVASAVSTATGISSAEKVAGDLGSQPFDTRPGRSHAGDEVLAKLGQQH